MIFQILILLLVSVARVEPSSDQTPIEIRLGFITKFSDSENYKHDAILPRPGSQFLDVFHHGVSKLNQKYHSIGSSRVKLKFKALVTATNGNESESIRQTISLITKLNVNAIVGPQESCLLESRLSSVFNVAMVSHQCSPVASANDQSPALEPMNPMTFVHTKPPASKIVQKVVTLVELLLRSNYCYPNQLVLLYYKELTGTNYNGYQLDSTGRNSGKVVVAATTSSASKTPAAPSVRRRQSNDALQYRLIGKLLELELAEILNSADGGGQPNKLQPSAANGNCGTSRRHRKQLSVLNWHTTYHYGYTKNPFRRILHRHLIQQQQSFNATDRLQCNPRTGSGGDKANGTAIYIVVGHYYEHLGLMLALDELNLLGAHPTIQQNQDQPQPQPQQSEWQQSSVVSNQEESVVIGVDIEPYDERVDSVHFLRGLLGGNQHGRDFSDLNLLAAKYNNYMGIVPSKPTRMAELQEDIRAFHKRLRNESSGGNHEAHEFNTTNSAVASIVATNKTVVSFPTASELFDFIRLPIEAFYLYDSIAMLGAYFSECLQQQELPLENCSKGNRIFEWFTNRSYVSSAHNNMTKFDLQAQADGFFTLISRNPLAQATMSTTTNEQPSDPSVNEDDFGLVPIGKFTSKSDAIEFFVNAMEIGQIWLPLWCETNHSNATECQSLSAALDSNINKLTGVQPNRLLNGYLLLLTLLATAALLASCLVTGRLYGAKLLQHSIESHVVGWFDENDERNFKYIVNNLLQSSETSALAEQVEEPQSQLQQQHIYQPQPEESMGKALVELHCFMFPFPSCKFVHWLVALHQLKEMMFKFQANLDVSDVVTVTSRQELRRLPGNRKRHSPYSCLSVLATGKMFSLDEMRSQTGRAFFTMKHRGTGTLKLLLHKYKSINDCLCKLNQLSHESVVGLLGATLLSSTEIVTTQSKVACLVVEKPDRGNIRDAIKSLSSSLNQEMSDKFRNVLISIFSDDIINGLEYLHNSPIGFHGELRASTCMVAMDWRLKLSGFHAHHMRRSLGEYEQKNADKTQDSNNNYLADLIYSAPEVLINHNRRSALSSTVLKLSDFYSFAFVFYELLVGQEPWECLTHVSSSKLLVERVKADPGFRPPMSRLDKTKSSLLFVASAKVDLDVIQNTIRSCWSHSPERRPQSIEILKGKLTSCLAPWKSSTTNAFKGRHIMRYYTRLLEDVSSSRGEALAMEHEQVKELRHCLLPSKVSARLCKGQPVISKQYDFVALCSFRFALTQSAEVEPLEQLNEILAQLDCLTSNYRQHIQLMDSQVHSSLSFLAYSAGLLFQEDEVTSRRRGINHASLLASYALQLIDLTRKMQGNFNDCLQIKCSLHCGSVLAGLIHGSMASGESRFKLARYVLFGKTLQISEILQDTSSPQRIQVSEDFRTQLICSPRIVSDELVDISSSANGIQDYIMIKREAKIQAKVFGDLEAYWLLNGPRLSASQSLMLPSAPGVEG